MATPLTKDRRTEHKALGQKQEYPVAAGVTIYKGSMVVLNAAGFAVEAINTAGFSNVLGIADAQVVNGGADGDVKVPVFEGTWFVEAEAGDEPTQALVGRNVYAASGSEVEATANDGIVAGRLMEIDGTTMVVKMGLGID